MLPHCVVKNADAAGPQVGCAGLGLLSQSGRRAFSRITPLKKSTFITCWSVFRALRILCGSQLSCGKKGPASIDVSWPRPRNPTPPLFTRTSTRPKRPEKRKEGARHKHPKNQAAHGHETRHLSPARLQAVTSKGQKDPAAAPRFHEHRFEAKKGPLCLLLLSSDLEAAPSILTSAAPCMKPPR